MDYLYIIAMIVAAIVGGFFLFPYLKSKNILTDENIDGMQKSVYLAGLIIDVFDLENSIREKSKLVLDIADIAVDYVDGFVSVEGDENKKQLSVEVVGEILEKLGISPTESEQRLIEIVIQEGLEYAKKVENLD